MKIRQQKPFGGSKLRLEMNPSFSLVGDQKANLVLAGQQIHYVSCIDQDQTLVNHVQLCYLDQDNFLLVAVILKEQYNFPADQYVCRSQYFLAPFSLQLSCCTIGRTIPWAERARAYKNVTVQHSVVVTCPCMRKVFSSSSPLLPGLILLLILDSHLL